MAFDTVKARLGKLRLVEELKSRYICIRYRILEFNIGLRCRMLYYRTTRAVIEKTRRKFSNAKFYWLSCYHWNTARIKDYIFAVTHKQAFNEYIWLNMRARNYYIVVSKDDDDTKPHLTALNFHDGYTYDQILRPATEKDVRPLLKIYFRQSVQGY